MNHRLASVYMITRADDLNYFSPSIAFPQMRQELCRSYSEEETSVSKPKYKTLHHLLAKELVTVEDPATADLITSLRHVKTLTF